MRHGGHVSVQEVARLAGVSASTVSRVINQHPSVSTSTAESVRRAMTRLNFSPTPRAMRSMGLDRRAAGATIAFLVLGNSGSSQAPAFEHLLRGVSGACDRHGLRMTLSFIAHDDAKSVDLDSRRLDGLLLHGARPVESLASALRILPTVWLMANRQRVDWGDQVMPDNTLIGDIAARHLLDRGHRRLAYLGVSMTSLGFMVRRLSFLRTAEGRGAVVHTAIAEEPRSNGYWDSAALHGLGQKLVDQVLSQKDRPTGFFVTEDRLVHPIYAALSKAGLEVGKGIDVVSCNNEQQHLVGLPNPPATIDIRAESIGARGVEQLIWRLCNRDRVERVRLMVEPKLVSPR